ncbi:hypothetical protein [Bradyrhizobium sp. LHD-71]|uniref:hypothetical protein n=1 Tax=Bradyrhizobium sp. LHD-71 TaxID=3072141 RepID=UPI00280E4231|nr:hypothetical protein [Bradyrhizobium sp. LHD-71]MDQ8728956.1 hypothetical protein [Bradyrhizobium sp. LHD-71]
MKPRLDEGQKPTRQDRVFGVAMLIAGLLIAGISLTQMRSDSGARAQATPPAAAPPDRPAEPMPGGARPTTPAPEPARPQSNPQDDNGSTTGSSPSTPRTGDRPPVTGTPLPPAPAEKAAPPIEPRK